MMRHYESSAGAKVVADYTRLNWVVINFKSNLIRPFKVIKMAIMSNWTWINSFGYTFWKGIGLGFEFGLRGNKQEAFKITY